MPYRVKMEGGNAVVENRYYKTLFVGRVKLPVSARDYDAIKATFLENAEEPFTPDGGSFWLYDDNTSPLGASYKKINRTLLKEYYNRLTCLLELFDGVDYSDDNPLMSGESL